MLFWLTQYLEHIWHVFYVFQYISFRCILVALTALIFSFLFGNIVIRKLNQYRIGQTIRELGPKSHHVKSGTPTMGGILILLSISVAVLLWADLSNKYIWVVLIATLGFGFVGLVDDYLKLKYRSSKGLKSRWKYFWQTIIGLSIAIFLYSTSQNLAQTQLVIPFFKYIVVKVGLFYIVISYFVIVGTSNAVNLTDGLDGLAILPTVLIAAALGIFAYLTGNFIFSNYLYIPFISGVSEVAIFASAIVGAGLGFLWFNTYPAEIFMGDVGSLGLGAALGVMAVIVRQELVLALMGGVFVLETLSVILQVASVKLTGRRIFKMAPLHHHFELKGWAEPKVIVRFWIVTFILVLLGLATLKLR